MFIALILPAPPAYSETFFRNKIKFLTDAGIKVVVFTGKKKGKDEKIDLVAGFDWDGSRRQRILSLAVAVFRIGASPLRSAKLFRLNRQDGFDLKRNLLSLITSAHILRCSPDWIHFGFATTAIGRENLARTLRAKMAVSIRGYDIAVYPLKHPGCYKLVWNRIDKLHHLSQHLLDLAVRHGFDRSLVHNQIEPAIDVTHFRSAHEPKLNLVSPLNILTVARLNWVKGLEYTLQALRILKNAGIDFQYTIIGEGIELERLKFAVHQLDIEDSVVFAGARSSDEVRKELERSSVYIQYSINEGFCNAVLEAQAMGLPTIVSDGGALAENVKDSKTGWVVPKRDPKALAKCLKDVITMRGDALSRLSDSSMHRIAQDFSLYDQQRRFLEFYEFAQ